MCFPIYVAPKPKKEKATNKKCTKCKEEKPLTDFYKVFGSKRSKRCKTCTDTKE